MENDQVPQWFNRLKGMKMMVVAEEVTDSSVTIRNDPAAELIIENRDGDRWLVKWKIQYSQNEYVNGQVIFSSDHLMQAFALTDDFEEEGSKWLAKIYMLTTASQGRFIRYRDYLNIPGPGTGHNHDANISIDIDKKMKEVILGLVRNVVLA